MNDTMQHKVRLIISDPSLRLLRANERSENDLELKKQNTGEVNQGQNAVGMPELQEDGKQ